MSNAAAMLRSNGAWRGHEWSVKRFQFKNETCYSVMRSVPDVLRRPERACESIFHKQKVYQRKDVSLPESCAGGKHSEHVHVKRGRHTGERRFCDGIRDKQVNIRETTMK